MSPTPFFVMKTGSREVRQNSLISFELFRKSEIGLMFGMIHTTFLNTILTLFYHHIERAVKACFDEFAFCSNLP